MNQANVSWEPGFDGGYTQKFTVWLVTHLNVYQNETQLKAALWNMVVESLCSSLLPPG